MIIYIYICVLCLAVLTEATQEMLDNMLVAFLNGIHGFFSQSIFENPKMMIFWRGLTKLPFFEDNVFSMNNSGTTHRTWMP